MSTRALVITSNVGVEQDELLKPLEFLRSKGIETIHAAPEQHSVQTVKQDKEHAQHYDPDALLSKIDADDYDILIIPGGTVNADTLRMNDDAQKLVRQFSDAQKPIAAICHGPWLLINAGRIKDKNLTSFSSIQLDLENAGGNWVNEEVHRCNTGGWVLITSRSPDDLPAFNDAILKELEGNPKTE